MHSIPPLDHLTTLLQEAGVCHHAGDLAGAESLYRQILATHADHCNAHDLLTSALLIKGRFDDAEVEFRNAEALRQILADTCNNFAGMLAAAGRIAEAESLYRQALTVDSRFVKARCNLACLLYRAQRFDEAAEHFRAALSVQPSSFDALAGLARALTDAGQSAASAVALKKALEVEPADAELWNDLGNAMAHLKSYGNAEAAYLTAMGLYPETWAMHRSTS